MYYISSLAYLYLFVTTTHTQTWLEISGQFLFELIQQKTAQHTFPSTQSRSEQNKRGLQVHFIAVETCIPMLPRECV